MRGWAVDQCEAVRLESGRVRVTVAGESVEADPATWRAVLFDAQVREDLRAVVSRELYAPVVSPPWWNGDGRG
jgi:hypothetical protein